MEPSACFELNITIMILINPEEFTKLGVLDKVPVKCDGCETITPTFKRDLLTYLRKRKMRHTTPTDSTVFDITHECRLKCVTKSKVPLVQCKCCKEEIYADVTNKGQRRMFCTKSCAATYNNLKRSSDNIPTIKYRRKEYKVSCTCVYCKKAYERHKYRKGKYCSNKCQQGHKHEHYYSNFIQDWKAGKKLGYTGKLMLIVKPIRKYLFNKYDNKCCKCGWNKIHSITNKIPLEVNHIDGDAANCKENNLELLCPSCHSLTPNFRALNKNSKRIH
jgi:hypothetical protein